MRTPLIVASLVATTALVVGGVALAQSSGASPAHRYGSTFTVVEHAKTDTTTDTGAKGDSVGDILTFANPVFGHANRHRVGSDNGSCLRTVKGKAYECSWTTKLDGGSLVVEGPFYDTRDSKLAIIGGTGRYQAARGQMLLHARNAKGSSYDFTFHVTR
ncbi:allene oxide cyclase family protein [Jatrophihabitans endophyticus]|uniref:allene oxide cyclase family protein n=1 Tax=Jatrophihabitans endophyticus TaxID=1206085 RepID=UPI0019EDACE9|nr:allene oxide cyclase family protein [Jatrophihabitans endophyticus]MBE7187116.1 dirigent protein [Jatrophihabitans endophyticus]